MHQNADTHCEFLSGADYQQSTEATAYKSDESNDWSLSIVYTGGSRCDADNNKLYSLRVDILCDRSQTGRPTPTIEATADPCVKSIKMSSYAGCPVFSVNAIWDFLSKYDYLWGALLIALGFVLAMFGRKLFKPVIFLVGMLAFVFVALLFMYSTFFDQNTSAAAGWITLVVSVLLGIVVGIILAKLSKLGVAVLAGWGGFCLGLVLWNAFLFYSKSQVAFWFFTLGIAVACGILSLFVFDHALIISTAIVGSYGFVRGISLYAGGYPNEFTIVQMLENGFDDQI